MLRPRPSRPPADRRHRHRGQDPGRDRRRVVLVDDPRRARRMARTIRSSTPPTSSVRFACEVRDFDPVEYFGPKEVRRQDRVTHLGFAAAADAIDDAGELGADPARCAVIAATGVGGLTTLQENCEIFFEQGPVAGQPVLRADDDAERDRGRHLDALRLDRPGVLHLDRVRRRRQRDRRGRPAHPRRQRRRRHRRRHRGVHRRSRSPRSPAWAR